MVNDQTVDPIGLNTAAIHALAPLLVSMPLMHKLPSTPLSIHPLAFVAMPCKRCQTTSDALAGLQTSGVLNDREAAGPPAIDPRSDQIQARPQTAAATIARLLADSTVQVIACSSTPSPPARGVAGGAVF